MFINVPQLLEDRQSTPPCGPNLEYHPDYVTLSKLVEGQPEVHFGAMHRAAQAPVWSEIQIKALSLLEQSHDLRLAVWLTSALLAQHAFPGLEEGLTLIEGMLRQHWQTLHPQLDAHDQDATARINVLLELNARAGLVREVIAAPLVFSSVSGNVSLRDILMALGEHAPPAEQEVGTNLAAIEVTFAETPYPHLLSTLDALKHSKQRLFRIDALLKEHLGLFEGFPALRSAIDRAITEVTQRLTKHPDRQHDTAPSQEAAQRSTSPNDRTCAIENRVDVLMALGRICDYYAHHEPGSPVPLLLQRVKRLVDMDFIGIVTHLAPAGLDEVLKLAGLEKAASE